MRACTLLVSCLLAPVVPLIFGARIQSVEQINATAEIASSDNARTGIQASVGLSTDDFFHCGICYHNTVEQPKATLGYLWGFVKGVGDLWGGFRSWFNEPDACMYHMGDATVSYWQNGVFNSFGETWDAGIQTSLFYCNVMCVPTEEYQVCTSVEINEDLVDEAIEEAKEDDNKDGGLGNKEPTNVIDRLEGEDDDVDDPEEVLVPECIGDASRVMHATASVNAPATCESETQTRTCDNNGHWTQWTGTFTEEACEVQARCSDPDTEHGKVDTRVRFEVASVNAPAQCSGQSQSRTCNNGVFSGWSGTHTQETCSVQARCTGPDTENGKTHTREMFAVASVNAPEQCTKESQVRTCNHGVFSSWSGSYTFASCAVQARCTNPDKAHGESDTRVMFSARSVNAPATCEEETQTRECKSGTYGSWSGSYSDETCSVQARCNEADIGHGETDARTMYAAPSVNAPEVCQSEVQERKCTNGALSAFSGKYTHVACVVQAQCANPLKGNGESETRDMWQASSVNAPEQCVKESQSRICTNGVYGSWSGSYTKTSCAVQARCSNPDKGSGEAETRMMYKSASVIAPEECVSEIQSRTCTNSAFGPWSGTFTNSACLVQARCNNPDRSHGDTDVRVMFAAESVSAPAACEKEEQHRTCNAGTFTSWSGTYKAKSCTVHARCSNPDAAHGGVDTRDVYATPTVISPATCQMENQKRTCNNGAYTKWSGTFESTTCQVKEPVVLEKCTAQTCKPGDAVFFQEDHLGRPEYAPELQLFMIAKKRGRDWLIQVWTGTGKPGDPKSAEREERSRSPEVAKMDELWLVPKDDARYISFHQALLTQVKKCVGVCQEGAGKDFCCLRKGQFYKNQELGSAASAACVAACTGPGRVRTN